MTVTVCEYCSGSVYTSCYVTFDVALMMALPSGAARKYDNETFYLLICCGRNCELVVRETGIQVKQVT